MSQDHETVKNHMDNSFKSPKDRHYIAKYLIKTTALNIFKPKARVRHS